MNSRQRDRRLCWPLLAALTCVAAGAIVGCVQWNEFAETSAPEVGDRWASVLQQLRRFERRIGFRDTNNFASVAPQRASYPICGRSSNRRLPYSYQDQAIEWPEIEHEAECRNVDADADVYFGKVEAWGEIGTPITAAMLASTLDRFVYVVIHEDCHDQFELPYGIEEPLCDLIAHHAMAQFVDDEFDGYAEEKRALGHYVRTEARRVRSTISSYARIEALYERFHRGAVTHAELLELRAGEFARAERDLKLEAGQLNNINLATYMTYSRHYPVLERIAAAWHGDLAGMVGFFRQVDARKPRKEEVLRRVGTTQEKDPNFLRAYEAAVLGTTHDMVVAER